MLIIWLSGMFLFLIGAMIFGFSFNSSSGTENQFFGGMILVVIGIGAVTMGSDYWGRDYKYVGLTLKNGETTTVIWSTSLPATENKGRETLLLLKTADNQYKLVSCDGENPLPEPGFKQARYQNNRWSFIPIIALPE